MQFADAMMAIVFRPRFQMKLPFSAARSEAPLEEGIGFSIH